MAAVFGPILTGSNREDPTKTPNAKTAPWAAALLELFIHAHGITEEEEAKSLLWRINPAFEEEIKEREQLTKTPKRLGFSTPRRVPVQRTPRRTSISSNRRLNFTGTRAPVYPPPRQSASPFGGFEYDSNRSSPVNWARAGSPMVLKANEDERETKRVRMF